MNQPVSAPSSAGSASIHNLHSNTLDSLKTRLLHLIRTRDTTREIHREKIQQEKHRQQHLLRENERLMRELRALRENESHYNESPAIENTTTLHYDQDEISLLSDDSSFKIFNTDTLQYDELPTPTSLPTLITGAPSSSTTRKTATKKKKTQRTTITTTIYLSSKHTNRLYYCTWVYMQ